MPTLLTWLLNAAYAALLLVLSPVIAWQAWRTGKYREGYREKLLGLVPERTGGRCCVWLHAVSVGEVNLLATMIGELGRVRPEWELVISTTTKTGYELATKKYGGDHAVFYCPLDFSWATRCAVRRVRPDLLVLAELELWPNLIASAKADGARVAIINGRLSDSSYRGYSCAGWLVRRVLGLVDLVAAQDDATAERFLKLGAATVATTGSLKYDGAETDRGNPRSRELARLLRLPDAGLKTPRVVVTGEAPDRTLQITPRPIVWIAGSTQAPEEQLCLDVFKEVLRLHPCLRLVLVPRHPERFAEVEALLQQSGIRYAVRSRITEKQTDEKQTDEKPSAERFSVLLVDTVGELGAWWGVADLGLVGGSFGSRGGQNMIEPAAYGVATCFGPYTRNFRDIVASLKAADGVREVGDGAALQRFVLDCLEYPATMTALGNRAKRFVATQLGATSRTAGLLESLVAENEDVEQRGRRVA